jgi:hypothetical protein
MVRETQAFKMGLWVYPGTNINVPSFNRSHSLFVPNFVPKTSNDLPTLAIAVFLFGASLFMILDEAMYRGVGRWLTKRLGGNNWVKQIDYIYLLMGSAGIVVSLNRLSMVTGKIEFLNDLGPLVLAAAIAIRLTKTRIEVNGWDKIGGKAPQDSKSGCGGG